MGQVRHGCATTTYAVGAATRRSQASTAAQSLELGINPKTVAKWRKQCSEKGVYARKLLELAGQCGGIDKLLIDATLRTKRYQF